MSDRFTSMQARLTVTSKERISDDMIRIWFSSNPSNTFQTANEGDYLKLVFPTDNEKPSLRTFTVARVNTESSEVAIDFVLHEDIPIVPSAHEGGFAHYFAHSSKQDDVLTVIGPNNKKSVLPRYDNVLFVADATAIPAMESILRHSKVTGQIVLFKCSATLAERLKHYCLPLRIADSVEALTCILREESILPANRIWCAGEYQMMRSVRRYAADCLRIEHTDQYFSSYWKNGMTEDGHKAFKVSVSD